MQFVIIGAGAIGSAIARELVLHDDVRDVRVVDSHSRALQDLAGQLPGPKLRSYQVDARDRTAIAPVMEGADCVIGAGSTPVGSMLAELSLDLGSHFCDLGGPGSVLGQEATLQDRARDVGRWVVPGCGLSPGLVNLLCLHGIDQFETVEAASIRVGDLPIQPTEPFFFQLGSSPEKLLDDYTRPARVIHDGVLTTVESLSDVEPIDFGDGFVHLEAFHTAGSLSHLSDLLLGRVRFLDHKTVQWPGHAARMVFLLGLGFGEARSIDVRTHLTYRDVLVRRMRQRLAPVDPDVVLARVVIRGTAEGRDRTLVLGMQEKGDPESGDSAIRRCTAIPAAVVARMLASGAVQGGGAAPPESVIPRASFLESMGERGITIHDFWLDGHVAVGEAGAL